MQVHYVKQLQVLSYIYKPRRQHKILYDIKDGCKMWYTQILYIVIINDFITAEATATATKGKIQYCQVWDQGSIAQAILHSKWHYSSHILWAAAFPSAKGRVNKKQLEKYKFTPIKLLLICSTVLSTVCVRYLPVMAITLHPLSAHTTFKGEDRHPLNA